MKWLKRLFQNTPPEPNQRALALQPLKALVCQMLALGLMFAVAGKLVQRGFTVPVILGGQGLLAALLSRWLGQPLWWMPIHLGFLPLAWWLLAYPLPAWWYLLALLVSLLVFWGTLKGDVPLFLSSSAVAETLAVIVDTEKASSLVDLGAGVGSAVVPLARLRPALNIVAVENAPLPWLLLRWRCRQLSNVRVVRKNLWHVALNEHAIVFAFLSPAVMERLGAKSQREMPMPSLLVSSSFQVPDWQADAVWPLADRRGTQLYAYRMPRPALSAPCGL